MLSFIIPAHNEAELIGRTLTAVHESARAAGEPYEVIVVNDTSRDETGVIAEEQVQAVGVWGNHDVGLCLDPGEAVCRRYSAVLAFMGSLQPHLEIGGCWFTHVEPWLDPHTVEALWSFHGPPDSPEKRARSFAATRQRVLFIGHLHHLGRGRRSTIILVAVVGEELGKAIDEVYAPEGERTGKWAPFVSMECPPAGLTVLDRV